MTRSMRRTATGLLAAAVAAAALVGTGAPGASAAPENTPGNVHRHPRAQKGPVDSPRVPTRPLAKATNVPTQPATVAPAENVDPIELKVLVLSADGTESGLPAIEQALSYLGTPYQVFKAAPLPSDPATNRFADPTSGVTLAEGPLETSIHAYYQAVIVATGELGYSANGSYKSALTPAEWSYLWAFEAKFGIRQLSWYTYPTPAYGFNWPTGAVDTTTSPLDVPFSAAGKSAFSSYLNTATPVSIKNAYTYLAQPLDDGNTTPLLSDGAGNALAAVRSYSDGRQALALTFDSNPHLLHTLVLSYGLVNWVTKGLFLGERHVYLSAQVDDLFIDNTLWPATTPCGTSVDDPSLPTYRMTAADLKATQAWQTAKQAQPTTKGLRLNMAYNGYGTTSAFYTQYKASNPNAQTKDTLTPEAKRQQSSYNWISHTYTHANLDQISYADAQAELANNDTVARNLAVTAYTKKNLVQPDVSGLANANFLTAAYDFGTRNVVSDTSRGGSNTNPSPNAGVANAIQPAILQIPRRPNNLYFNVSTPAEWLAEDNCLYPAGAYGHVSTYDQLLERESNVLVSYLLKGDVNPWMFHQPNLRAYDGTRSLLGDLLDRTLAKYNTYFTLPVLSPTMDELGTVVTNRMQYNASGANANIVPTPSGPASITVKTERAAVVPVTGLATSGAEVYGGQYISHLSLAAGQSVTYSAASGLSPTTLTFAAQQLNTTSAAQTVTLTNRGTMQSAISSITTSGDFAQTNNCGTDLAPGASCAISVTFRPTASGTRTGSLVVVDTDAASPRSVALSGTGTSVSLTPTSIDFGTRVPLLSSTSRTVTLTNADSAGRALAIKGIRITGTNASEFTQTNNCGTRLSAGASCTITVTFRPSGFGDRTATLAVEHDVAGGPRAVPLTGTAGV